MIAFYRQADLFRVTLEDLGKYLATFDFSTNDLLNDRVFQHKHSDKSFVLARNETGINLVKSVSTIIHKLAEMKELEHLTFDQHLDDILAMKKIYDWKCLVCEKSVEVVFDGNDDRGILPCLVGGTLSIDCAYGSQFDMLTHPARMAGNVVETQGCICDDCFGKKQHLLRQVQIEQTRTFKQVNGDTNAENENDISYSLTAERSGCMPDSSQTEG